MTLVIIQILIFVWANKCWLEKLIFTLQVEIYPLKIHLTETMYRMMWGYLFPEEEQDSQRRQVGLKC